MAQLKDLIVTGASQLIGDVFTNKIQITTLNAPTSSGGTTYGSGTAGYVLKTNGSSIYWSSLSASTTAVVKAITFTQGSLPTLGTEISIPNVTNAGSLPNLTYSEVTIPNVTNAGSLPSLTYSEKSIPNVTSTTEVVASVVTKNDNTVVKTISQAASTESTIASVSDSVLSFSKAITAVGTVSAGSTATASAVTISSVTATKVTLGTAIAVNSVTTWNAGAIPTLGTAIKVNSVTTWNAGAIPTLGTAISVPNVTGVGSLPTLSATTINAVVSVS